MRGTTVVTALLLCAAGASGDVVRNFVLEPEQVVPAAVVDAAGYGRATLNPAQTQLAFLVEHGVEGASLGSATVRNADWGVNGPTVFTLTYVDSNSFNGTWNLSAGDVAEFQAGRLYVQIDVPAYPAGAVRGQLDVKPAPEVGDVIITEIMYNPASYEGGSPTFISNPEWIELFNTTYSDINIGGWYLQDEDADETVDPCVPMRSGSMPDFVLPSFGLVVIIPDGEVQFGSAPSVADFKTAWNLSSADNVIQLLPDGTAGGSIVGRNLSNSPINDGFDVNDLPLDAPYWAPCDPGGFERPDNEILTLNDGMQVIDIVNYDDGFPYNSGWPDTAGFNSISLVPVDYPNFTDLSSYTATGNDAGSHWIAHTIGDQAIGRKQLQAAGVYGGSDVGSPCVLLAATSGNLPPTPVAAQALTTPGATKNIILEGTDRTRPFFGLLLFFIKSLPQNGQLWDVASNRLITPAMIGSQGYLMPRIPFNQVRYINNGTCGVDQFTFSVSDGVQESAAVPVEIFVQCGEVVITEIMYNPDSAETDITTNAPSPALPEWVELYNASAKPINLAGWYLRDNLTRSGEMPPYILGAHSAVTVLPPAVDPAEFEAAWPLSAYVHLTTNGETGFGGSIAGSNLNNSGDALRVVQPGGSIVRVHDAVFYRSGFEDPLWPALSPDGPSIYLLPSAGYTAGANDDPAVWAESIPGVDGAYFNMFTTVYNGVDIGSPSYLPGMVQGNCPVDSLERDGNGDGSVDLTDFAHLQLCLSGPDGTTPLNCACFDVDVDDDVDLRDFNAFQTVLP